MAREPHVIRLAERESVQTLPRDEAGEKGALGKALRDARHYRQHSLHPGRREKIRCMSTHR